MTLSAGARLGAYEIRGPLGAGGMGEVFRAWDLRLERDVAIKVLPEALGADADRVRRFEREARAASSLSHPNIVTIYEIGSVDSRLYIAMELAEGRNLRELLSTGPLPTRRLVEIAGQIATGLARAHEVGIVHRDLKPDNVMVSKDGIVKIVDFGLAKWLPYEGGAGGMQTTLTTATEAGIVLGTVGYMSPEQASGQPVDFRSDQFSFGSVLYEMVTGRRAFERPTKPETLAAIIREDPEPIAALNPRVPAPLRWIVERCHAKEAKNRYASTDDLARDLTMLREHLSEVGGLASGPEAARPRRDLVRWVVAGAGVLAIGLLGNLVASRSRGPAEPPRFRQLTFRNGHVESARFALNEQTVVYAANWDGRPIEIFLGRTESPEFRPFGMPGVDILAVSKSGEMALSLNRRWFEPFKLVGTLARMGVASVGAPREVLEDVFWADWSPDGRDLAIVRQVDGLSRLEYPIGKALYEEPTGFLSHPRVSRDGGLVAFLEHPAVADDRGGVGVVDRAGNKKSLVKGFAAVWGLAWSPDGSEVWFTGAPTGIARALYAVDLSGRRRVLARVAGSVRLDDVAASGRVLLTHQHIKQHLVALGPGDSRERDLSWLDYSLAEAISPDGRAVLFNEGGEGGGPEYSAFLRRTDGSPAVRLGEGIPLAFSPDGKWALAIVHEAAAPSFVLYPTGPGEPRPLPNDGLRVIGGTFMPDGRRILLWAREEGHRVRLYLQDLAGGKPRAISPEGFRGYAGGVSPDGKFVTVIGPEEDIYLYPIEGGEPRKLATLTEDDAPGGWTADGRYIYVIGPLSRPRRVDRLEVATGKRELWKELTPDDPEGSATAIRLTPDGRHYAYTYLRDESDLFLVEGIR